MRTQSWLAYGVGVCAMLSVVPAEAQRPGGGGMRGGMMMGGMRGGGMMMGGGMRGGAMMGGRGGRMGGGGSIGGGMSGGSPNDMIALQQQMRQRQMQMKALANIVAARQREQLDRQLVASRRARMAEEGNEAGLEEQPITSRERAAARMWGRREASRARMAARRPGR